MLNHSCRCRCKQHELSYILKHTHAHTHTHTHDGKQGGGKHIALSSIFNWFARDFRPTPIKFLFPYLPEKAQEIVKANRYKMKKDFMEYDWGINMPSKSS
mmetsp:Transcript_29946/g.48766  ORF Transcript_29946/g.48766 Transcript_29946/m.48766 type:complete len:100 (+) Transcript_29946:376-675(+)